MRDGEDDITVAFVADGDAIEMTGVDPRLGVVANAVNEPLVVKQRRNPVRRRTVVAPMMRAYCARTREI